mmetsp:Transcript_95276/g.269312  ORF Transcript_95276/g.269312 Transcript_95276/m.269312 type:complete len:233 (-) Transcript_95276:2-700(-)
MTTVWRQIASICSNSSSAPTPISSLPRPPTEKPRPCAASSARKANGATIEASAIQSAMASRSSSTSYLRAIWKTSTKFASWISGSMSCAHRNNSLKAAPVLSGIWTSAVCSSCIGCSKSIFPNTSLHRANSVRFTRKVSPSLALPTRTVQSAYFSLLNIRANRSSFSVLCGCSDTELCPQTPSATGVAGGGVLSRLRRTLDPRSLHARSSRTGGGSMLPTKGTEGRCAARTA